MTSTDTPPQDSRPEKKPLLPQNVLAFLLIANLVIGVLTLVKSRESSENAYWAAQNATKAYTAASRAAYEAREASFNVQQLSFR